MKKILLSMAAAALAVANVEAQRLVLYEEFSGENCGPCAAANPGLNTRLAANPTKIVLLKYQTPIPSAGPIYYQNTPDVQNRLTYYTVPFAPYGRADGKVLGTTQQSPGHVNYLTQAEIDNAYNTPTSFSITATHSWSTDGDSVYATINVTATSAFAPAGAQMKLRAALVEDLDFATPPGTNGETSFHHVMRKMYPTPDGIAVANSWTANQTQSISISGPVPSYVNKAGNVFMIVWLQNDADKIVAQAGKSNPVTLPLDAGSESVAVPTSLVCGNPTASVTPTVTLKNAGSTTLTSAKIFYKIDNNAWQTYNWTGSVAAGNTANVALPALSVPVGVHIISDSVAAPNNGVDINAGNSSSLVSVNVQNSTPVALPLTDTFANALKTGWLNYDVNNNGQSWQLVQSSGGNGHSPSFYLRHENYNIPQGDINYLVLPVGTMPAGAKALDFWMGYCQYDASSNDALDIVYSTNCGQSWTTVWSGAGAAMATAPVNTAYWQITHNDWKFKSVDLTSVPANAMLAFKATSDYGNNLFIDDVNLRAGAPVGVKNVAADYGVRLFPNPARESARLSFDLQQAGKVQVSLVDALGRVVAVIADGEMANGSQDLTISTSSLSAGTYTVKIQTATGFATERLTVIK